MMFGTVDNPKNQGLADLNWREVAVFAPIVLLCFWIGLYPKPFITPMEKSIEKVVRAVDPEAVAADRAAAATRIGEARQRFERARLERSGHGAAGTGHGE
jgi:NADH-quinone oxidoreductase subunit M